MMSLSRPSAHGVGLVEVLVALVILAMNVLGWSAMLSLALTLVRLIADLGGFVDPVVTAIEACGLAIVAPRISSRARCKAHWAAP